MIELTLLKELMLMKQTITILLYLPLLVFLNERFMFQTYVCNGCHVLLMISIYLDDIDILILNSIIYCCIISRISNGEAVNL